MELECSFCGRGTDEILTLFRPGKRQRSADAHAICICDRCIENCHRRLVAKKEYFVESADKQRLRDALEESTVDTLIRAIVDNDYRDLFLQAFAENADLAEVDPDTPPEPAALRLLPESFMRANGVLAWRIENDRLVVAFYNPLHFLDVYDEVTAQAGMIVRPALLPRTQLLESLEKYLEAGE